MPQESENLNLNDAIAAQFDILAAETPAEPEVVETAEIADVEEMEVSAEETPETTEVDEPEQIEAEGSETEVEVDEEPVYDEAAPERWDQDTKEYYNGLDPRGKEIFLDKMFKPMQRKYVETTTELSEMRKQIEPVMEAMKQYSGQFERAGLTPVEAIRRQAAWAAHILDVGAEQGMADMAKSLGVGGVDHGQEQEYLTPVERQQQDRIDRLEQNQNTQQQTAQQQEVDRSQNAQRRRYNEINTDLQSFINEQKDGKPAHPHVEKVAPKLAGIMKSGLVNQTDDYGQPVPFLAQIGQAYKMACDLDPSIKTVGVTNLNKRQVARARAAQDVGVVTNVPSGTPSDVPTKTLSERINDTYDKMAGNG